MIEILAIIIVVILACLLVAVFIISNKNRLECKNALEKLRVSEQEKNAFFNELQALRSRYESESSKKKSEQVRLGHIVEQLAPFLDNFKHDPKDLIPMFQPIDYVCFEDEQITFIEVKSGGAQLSTKQKQIKKLVEDGKVKFEIYRVK